MVLDNQGEEHCVVRLECIAAVRVGARAPMLRRIPVGHVPDTRFDGAVPMPGPQAAAAWVAV